MTCGIVRSVLNLVKPGLWVLDAEAHGKWLGSQQPRDAQARKCPIQRPGGMAYSQDNGGGRHIGTICTRCTVQWMQSATAC